MARGRGAARRGAAGAVGAAVVRVEAGVHVGGARELAEGPRAAVAGVGERDEVGEEVLAAVAAEADVIEPRGEGAVAGARGEPAAPGSVRRRAREAPGEGEGGPWRGAGATAGRKGAAVSGGMSGRTKKTLRGARDQAGCAASARFPGGDSS